MPITNCRIMIAPSLTIALRAMAINRKSRSFFRRVPMSIFPRNDYDRAIADYSTALRWIQNLPNVGEDAGTRYAEKEDYDRCAGRFRSKRSTLDPKDPENIAHRAGVYYWRKEFERTLTEPNRRYDWIPRLSTPSICAALPTTRGKNTISHLPISIEALRIEPDHARAW